mgnify:CR=1 FL=1
MSRKRAGREEENPDIQGLKAILQEKDPRTALVYRSGTNDQNRNISRVYLLLTFNGYESAISFEDISKPGLIISLLTVDHELFERDVRESAMGEMIATRLVTPYTPLIGKAELIDLETVLKKRTITESLENLVLEYSTLTTELAISPEYFLHADIQRLSRVYPMLSHQFSWVTSRTLWKRNRNQMMRGYTRALRELHEEKIISFSNGSVRISDRFVGDSLQRSNELADILGSIQKATRPYVLAGKAITANPLSVAREIIENAKEDPFMFWKTTYQLEEPSNFLFLKRGRETVPISQRLTVDDFVTKTSEGKPVREVRRERLFGFLNSVYLLSVRTDSVWTKYVVKFFLDWSGYKWFPLALWTLGIQNFAVSGKKRMANEYAMSQLLRAKGFSVPDIYDISWDRRLIFERFVEGRSLDEMISNVLTGGFSEEQRRIVELAGETIGRIHKLDICLGDCKPENMIFGNDQNLYLVDLEQARRKGNPAWDIAEFLYFSVLYVPEPGRDAVKELAVNFLRGYLGSHGDPENVRDVGDPKYHSVFAPFEPVWTLTEISKICQDPMDPSLDKFCSKAREEH